MSKHLKIADDLSLPLELAARTQCIFAQKGAGKTYCAGVQTEEMLGAGVQMCILDPTGVWWGLQSSADGGKSPYEIIVMGGSHADVPLEPDAGEIIANFLVETGQSVVLDVSQFESQAAQDRFALALATKLYRLKAHDRANIHIMLDEADQFCPMKPQKGQERLLHAWSLIVRLGRSRGLGLTAISNRPAAVHTDIRNNIDLLTCMRVTGPHDFKALREWTSIHATQDQAKEFLETVPALPNGEAFFWSPSWLGIFKRVGIRQKYTFDSSRTPKPGERTIEPKARRAPDLTKLTEQIKSSVQRAKENDPALLKKQVAQFKAELAKSATAKPQTETKVVEKPVVTDAQVTRIEKTAAALEREGQRRVEHADKLAQSGKDLIDFAKAFLDSLARAANQPVPAAVNHRPIERRQAPAPVRREIPPADATGRDALTGPERKILDAIAWMESIGIAQPEQTAVAFLAGYTYGGGGFNNPRGALNTKGLVEYVGGGLISLTEAGRAVATYPKDELTNERMREKVLSVLPGPEQRILIPLLDAYPNEMSNTDLAAAANYTEGSGGYNNPRGRLRTLGLIEYTRGGVRARDILFPETAGVR